MKKLKLLAAMLMVSVGTYAQKLPADSIFAQFYKATGGKALWDGVKSYNIKRSYAAAAATPYDAVITASLPDQSIYKNKTIMKRSFVYTVKGDQGWVKVPIGPKVDVKDLSQAEQQNMRQELYDNLVPFIDYKNRGLIATTVGTETLNGVPVNNVELQGKGVKYNLYFDAKTGLLVRQKTSEAGVEITTDLSDYAKSAYGILYPTKLVELNSTDKKPVTIKSALTVNDQVNVELFKR
ncbi:hypothetical protein GCM10010967_34440 [Dyadobacter beijingensis]|uniref:Salt-induced outer membrane protein n=1 Tax=Dyadobacter beijingensis TaxID=365489 RepID=A0ABQ2I409_9BACT|nr:hypothetical protein [Dyadobacter beijingensis]GGM97676.1 hypothetical protein GCM10010967_34440 [Dyadobacter beijingensis]